MGTRLSGKLSKLGILSPEIPRCAYYGADGHGHASASIMLSDIIALSTDGLSLPRQSSRRYCQKHRNVATAFVSCSSPFQPTQSLLRGEKSRLSSSIFLLPKPPLGQQIRYVADSTPGSLMSDIYTYIAKLYRAKGSSSSGIVYCRTKAACNQLAEFLKGKGIRARPYHAELEYVTMSISLYLGADRDVDTQQGYSK